MILAPRDPGGDKLVDAAPVMGAKVALAELE